MIVSHSNGVVSCAVGVSKRLPGSAGVKVGGEKGVYGRFWVFISYTLSVQTPPEETSVAFRSDSSQIPVEFQSNSGPIPVPIPVEFQPDPSQRPAD